MLLLTTFLYCAASAVIPVLPAELWVAGLVAKGVSSQAMPAHVTAAASGQMLGKMLIFLAARGTMRSQWLQRRVHSKHAKSYEGRSARLLERAEASRGAQVILCGVSAFLGLPPFLLVSALLGTLNMRLGAFLMVGFLGRAGRFGLIVAVPAVTARWLVQ